MNRLSDVTTVKQLISRGKYKHQKENGEETRIVDVI